MKRSRKAGFGHYYCTEHKYKDGPRTSDLNGSFLKFYYKLLRYFVETKKLGMPTTRVKKRHPYPAVIFTMLIALTIEAGNVPLYYGGTGKYGDSYKLCDAAIRITNAFCDESNVCTAEVVYVAKGDYDEPEITLADPNFSPYEYTDYLLFLKYVPDSNVLDTQNIFRFFQVGPKFTLNMSLLDSFKDYIY